jgi:hypothetical protein
MARTGLKKKRRRKLIIGAFVLWGKASLFYCLAGLATIGVI